MQHALTLIAYVSLAVAFSCALGIALDELKHPQKMWIMNIVWPVTALYFSVAAVWAYYKFGRKMERKAASQHARGAQKSGNDKRKSSQLTWPQIAVAAFHCGAGCTLADIVTEFTIFALGLTLFGEQIWASFVFDFAAAWSLGIVFQYFTIAPMRNLSLVDGLIAAIKADTLSITAFQVGMYAWMAVVYFVWFPQPHLHPTGGLYWFLMQIAMIIGFFTAYPMNAWLIRRGLKEAMG